MERQPEHDRVAALDAERQISRSSQPVHRANVPGRSLALVVRLRLVLVIIAVVLELERKPLPGGLVLHAAKQCRWSAEIAAQRNVSSLTHIQVSRGD